MAEISISTINVNDGHELGETSRAFTQRPNRDNKRPEDTLIVYCDLPTASDTTLDALAKTIADTYQSAPGGCATALRLSIKLANEQLLNQNLGAEPAVRGSVSCVAISGNHVVLAQSGPAIAYARAQNGAFERIAPPGRTPLFGSGGVEVYAANFVWQPGDAFVITGLTSLSNDGKVPDALIDACMSKGDGRLIAGYLNANVKAGFMAGLAFSLGAPTAPADRTAPRPVPHEPGVRQPKPTAASAWTNTPAITSSGLPARTASVTNTPSTPSGSGKVALYPRVERVIAALRLFIGQLRAVTRRSQQSSSIERASRIAIKLSPEAERTQRILFAGLALILPVIVAATVSAFSLQLSTESDMRSLRTQVQDKVKAAQTSFVNDPSNSAKPLSDAIAVIRGFELRAPGDKSFDATKLQLQTQVDSIFRVQRVGVTILPPFANASVRRIAAFDGGVYVLDTATNSVDQLVLSSAKTELTGTPIRVAPQRGVALPVIKDVTWTTPRNNRWPSTDGALMVGVDDAYLFSTGSGQLSTLKLGNKIPQTVAGDVYAGLFYQLDTAEGQIWRQRVQGESVLSTAYLTQPMAALQDGIDLVVDGSLFILRKPSSDPPIIRLTQGRATTFTLSGLPEPLRQPVAIATNTADPETGSLFVADSASGAIIELTKNGEYIRQIRAKNDEMVGVQDISYDFANDIFYAVSPRQLFVFKP